MDRTLVHAGVASSGTADSYLNACHVTHMRRVHQITVHLLMKKAYNDSIEVSADENQVTSLKCGILIGPTCTHSSNSGP